MNHRSPSKYNTLYLTIPLHLCYCYYYYCYYYYYYYYYLIRLAVDAARGLHPGVVTMTMNNALWSLEEETLLAKIPSVCPGLHV